MKNLFESLRFSRGPAMRNRFALAPLTNLQSHADGTLSDDEYHWLTLRARGGFGLTMTCAAHVQAVGQGFAGQLGIFSDAHLPGLTRLAAGVRSEGSLAVAQLHHAGLRSPAQLIGVQPVAPSADADSGARALTLDEVEAVREDFIAAALRAERAGFDGIEVHGAHSYLVCQFLSAENNRRDDCYGGSLEGRARLLMEIVTGIRARCRPDFLVGVRLSPERFGMRLGEVRDVAAQLMRESRIDFLDLSLWDAAKRPQDEQYQDRTLLGWFTDLERGNVRLGATGKIGSAAAARACLDGGADFAIVGRAAILHHDFPLRVQADPDFAAMPLPVSADHLRAEGLGEAFIAYMASWQGFVAA